MAYLEPKRARRRRVTLMLACRRRDEHVKRVHTNSATGEVSVACICELADTYFAKRSAHGCGCRKRRKGRPKVAAGMCDVGDRDRIYEWRQEARELRVAVLTGRLVEDELPPPREWPKGKEGPHLFMVEKRDLDRLGQPRGNWYVYRQYRKERDRDNALGALRKTLQVYDIRSYQAGDEGTYRGPRAEFRAGGGSNLRQAA